jgi:hypothetical protein
MYLCSFFGVTKISEHSLPLVGREKRAHLYLINDRKESSFYS